MTKVRKKRGGASEDDSLGDQDRRIEVQEEASVEMGGFQVRSDLGEVDILKCLRGFDFDDDLTVDEEVQSMESYVFSFKPHPYDVLPVEGNASVPEGDRECILANGLQESRPQPAMNINGRLQNAPR